MTQTASRVYSYEAVLMGSPILLKIFEDNPSAAKTIFQLIKQQENLLTVNRAGSQLMMVNEAAGLHPVQVSQSVFDLVSQAKDASLQKDSCFNLAIGPLVKRWKIGFRGNTVPTQSEIDLLLTLTNPADVVLDESNRTIFLAKQGMEIDLGAIAKGYIADLVRDKLHAMGIQNGLINLGGNVLTIGQPLYGDIPAWGVGLQKPFASHNQLIGIIEVCDKSVVTSGVYERYFEKDGRIYHHIFDPKTGYPLDNELLSVTVISDDSIDGDIYTTILYGMGVEKSLKFLANQPQIEAIFVTRSGGVILSSERQFKFNIQDDSYQLIHQD